MQTRKFSQLCFGFGVDFLNAYRVGLEDEIETQSSSICRNSDTAENHLCTFASPVMEVGYVTATSDCWESVVNDMFQTVEYGKCMQASGRIGMDTRIERRWMKVRVCWEKCLYRPARPPVDEGSASIVHSTINFVYGFAHINEIFSFR